MKKTKVYHIIVFIVLFIIGFIYLNKVFATPNHFNNTISDFKKLSKETNIDLVFYGSSHVYTAYNPLVFNRFNKTISYNLGSDAFKLHFTDLLFLESIKYTHPKLVVLELYPPSLYDIEGDEDKGFQLRGLDFVSNFSFRKFKEVCEVYDFNEIAGVYSPLIRNHSKWSEVDYFDLDRNKDIDTIENYFYAGFIGSRHIASEKLRLKYTDFDRDDYLHQKFLSLNSKKRHQIIDFVNLVKKNGIDVLILSSPDMRAKLDFNEYFYIELQEICNQLNIQFLNLNDHTKEIGLNLSDFKDHAHLNTYGSLKTSIYLAEYIRKNYQLPDRSNEEVWKQSAIKYDLFKKEYYTKTKYFQADLNQKLTEGISVKNIKIKSDYSYEFSVQLDVDDINTLDHYKMAIHAYPTENNEVYLKNRESKFDIADVILKENKTDLVFEANTRIKEFEKIELFLYSNKGFDGVIGNKVIIYPEFN